MKVGAKQSLKLLVILSQLALIKAYQNETSSSATSTSADSEGTGDGGLVFTGPSSIRPNNDPQNTVEIVQQARKNKISAEMVTNRTKALVSCETGEILVKINFTEPFRGVAYADYDSSSPCKFFGEGGNYYEMRLPLKGCGTKQEAPRLFINNIVLRFHRSLELEEDEEKTIVCRYPPPQALAPPPAPGPPAKIVEALPEPAKLTQYEPFILIAGLLFFALLLAGVGTTSYVVRKETIKPINTPFPLITQTEYDNNIYTQSVNTIVDIETTHKLAPLPKISAHIFEDVYLTETHEIDTIENLVHQKQVLPKLALEHRDLEDTHITNQDEITSEEVLRQQRLKDGKRRLGRQDCDDTYLTNQNETIDDELTTHHKALMERPNLEVRTIEDTFITIVDEKVEREDTTYLKNSRLNIDETHDAESLHHEEFEERHSHHRDC